MTPSDPSAASDAPEPQFFRELLKLLRPFWALSLFSTVVGVVGGLATAGLLSTINDALHQQGALALKTVLSFIALCIVALAGNAIAGVGNSVIGQRLIASLRKDISARIVSAPIASIERFRLHRMMATLTNDVDMVSSFTFNFSSYAVALAVTLGCIVYMLVLSPLLFLLVAVVIVLGVLLNHYSSRHWTRHYQGVRTAQDDLHKQYRAITEGAKELRLSRERRARVYGEHLVRAVDQIADRKTSAMRLFWITDAAGATLFFISIGVMLILQYHWKIDPHIISGFVLVQLFVRGPLEQLANGLPALAEARVAMKRIAELSAQFQTREAHLAMPVSSSAASQTSPSDVSTAASAAHMPAPHSLQLQQTRYCFAPTAGVTPFELGPVDLEIKGGEMLFIVGDNGCGKTTLIKLLLGLYTPTSGNLLWNGTRVEPERLDDYRQQFSAVFSDYHLFDDLVTSDAAEMARANIYLKRFEIAHKVKIEEGVFSTIDLSAGQRKRLALVHAMLERRPVMMFDEWAADQDPTFRRVFYTQFLPELKRQGKTLIVITHDDRYFALADRVMRLEHGKVISIEPGATFHFEDGERGFALIDALTGGAADK